MQVVAEGGDGEGYNTTDPRGSVVITDLAVAPDSVGRDPSGWGWGIGRGRLQRWQRRCWNDSGRWLARPEVTSNRVL